MSQTDHPAVRYRAGERFGREEAYQRHIDKGDDNPRYEMHDKTGAERVFVGAGEHAPYRSYHRGVSYTGLWYTP